MDKIELKQRTKAFALRILALVDALPRTQQGKVVGYQITKSGTSVGANYRAACRARSRAEYVSKLQIVLEEADETAFWLEIIDEAEMLSSARPRHNITTSQHHNMARSQYHDIAPEEQLSWLQREADELIRIVNSTIRGLRKD